MSPADSLMMYCKQLYYKISWRILQVYVNESSNEHLLFLQQQIISSIDAVSDKRNTGVPKVLPDYDSTRSRYHTVRGVVS
jgi:hypothetical protein